MASKNLLLQKLRLPDGFAEWAWRTGTAQRILRGEKDIVEALEEWQVERERKVEEVFKSGRRVF